MTARSPKPPRAWQRMLSGRRLDLLDPSPLDIEIEDIAHGLARVPRWNGQTEGAHIFSVAQHSVLVEQIARNLQPDLTRDVALTVLLHDAAEYVIGDMISPFKAIIGANYREIEKRLMDAVHLRFGVAKPTAAITKLIKQADRSCAYMEATQLAGFARVEAANFFGKPQGIPDVFDLAPWPADQAKAIFLARFSDIFNADK